MTEHKAAMTATICQTEMSGQESRIKSESSGKAPKGVSVQGNGYSVMDDLVCRHCGSVICVDGDDEQQIETLREETGGAPATKQSDAKQKTLSKNSTTKTSPKVKVTPNMLRLHTIRRATRCAMLAAIPGVKKRVAAQIISVYPTFTEIVRAGMFRLMQLHVTKQTKISEDCARAIVRALR